MDYKIRWLLVGILCVSLVSTQACAPAILSKAEISALLINSKESGEVVEPSRPEIEGQSGSKYTVEYFPNGSMIYTLHGEPQKWTYRIGSDSERGAYFCRGKKGVGRNCRNIVKVGPNIYEAVGYNTGKLRYKFSINK